LKKGFFGMDCAWMKGFFGTGRAWLEGFFGMGALKKGFFGTGGALKRCPSGSDGRLEEAHRQHHRAASTGPPDRAKGPTQRSERQRAASASELHCTAVSSSPARRLAGDAEVASIAARNERETQQRRHLAKPGRTEDSAKNADGLPSRLGALAACTGRHFAETHRRASPRRCVHWCASLGWAARR
jgi:hypothetical protein